VGQAGRKSRKPEAGRHLRHAHCTMSRSDIVGAYRRYLMDTNTTTGNAGAGTGTETADESSGRFGRARDYASERYEAASGKVRDGYNTMRERVEDVDFGAITDQVRTYVRSNPGKALLISVGVGFLVGLLLRRDDED
jgi:ElaB/YqjD/DUF883 family membrane-anchored ribosome-binding protein